MKVVRILSIVLITLAISISLFAIPVLSAAPTVNEVEAELIPSKASYSGNEAIGAILSARNLRSATIENVNLEIIAPNGYKIAAGSYSSKQVEQLASGETIELSSEFTKTTSPFGGVGGGGGGSSYISNRSRSSSDVITIIAVVVLVLLVGGVTTVIILLVKNNKKGVSVILALVISLSALACIPAASDAQEPEGKVITVTSAPITIDGTEVQLEGYVRYGYSEALTDFNASEVYFPAGFPQQITFTVQSNIDITESVQLIKSPDEVAAEMNDNGEYGDVQSGDGIYSCIVNVSSQSAQTIDYYVKTGDNSSASLSIYFFERETQTNRDTIDEVRETITGIESKYLDNNGYIPESTLSALIEEICVYAQKLCDNGTLIRYEATEESVYLKFSSGTSITYVAPIKDKSNIGSDISMTVSTYQPCLSGYPAILSEVMPLADEAAQLVGSTFANYTFSESTNYDNEEVTLEQVKKLGKNSLILWHGHGSYSNNLHSIILTGEDYNWVKWLTDLMYWIDSIQDVIIPTTDGGVAFTSKFINRYVESLEGSIVYLATCSSGRDNVLANTFLDKGALAFIGNTGTILTEYNLKMLGSTISNMTKINTSTQEYNTLLESLNAAKTTHGINDGQSAPVIFGGTEAENIRLGNVASGSLSGKVCRASDSTIPVGEALIEVYKDSEKLTSSTANAEGEYSISLAEGSYIIKISAPGYISFDAYVSVADEETTYVETLLLVDGDASQSGTASGIITNALTGIELDGVTLTARKGWNNAAATDSVGTATTDSSGAYSINLPLGNYTLTASKDGFIGTSFNIVVRAVETTNQNSSISPIISGDDFRIVLTWGENPEDLDAHLIGTDAGGNDIHVYFQDKSHYYDDTEVCNLDVDDTSSYGPETITLKATGTSPYYFLVHRYEGSGSLATSNAQVKVFQGSTCIATYSVPTNSGTDDIWNVFAIVNGEIISRNTITSDVETGYADN